MAQIVVIDDEPGMLRMITRALEKCGHTVTSYENGRHAIQGMETTAPDLVITDIFMPEMDGLELTRELTRSRPKCPIIAVSGASELPDYLGVAQNFGATILRKPFRPIELVELVDRLLAH